jgi:hypothetical protein
MSIMQGSAGHAGACRANAANKYDAATQSSPVPHVLQQYMQLWQHLSKLYCAEVYILTVQQLRKIPAEGATEVSAQDTPG